MAYCGKVGGPSNVEATMILLNNLLPLLSKMPLTSKTLTNIVTLCKSLKSLGPQIDALERSKMDLLQTLLTKICQDGQVSIYVRLHALEIIELRTLNWERSEAVENYYRERYQMYEDKQRKDEEANKSVISDDKSYRRRTSPKDFGSATSIDDGSKDSTDVIMINGEKVHITSENVALVHGAKKLIVNHFFNQTSSPFVKSNVQYSRHQLLSLSTSPLSKEAPVHWDKIVKSVPAVIIKNRKEDSSPFMVGSGDNFSV